jgi:hypothetical protein
MTYLIIIWNQFSSALLKYKKTPPEISLGVL